ncbi:aminotransferase class V-fold PLP-dependent enzyme [Alkalisalibacterium limincola]|uniref:Aminotransferase class V-fold PLP-dependent enzyme n=1 Tax=Alkalisalibacterium limincola TaxID=2699169 RepID=A0A5C8KI75_9GAMM|nr:aminotransferase class V-fold PLP-dependent enzyme [Alkalisalibacterium limincola]TXK59630.1 aminotransferase class V-fold PLP-dependent enzyme [Alkalisalibacterium limincola]
MSLTRRELLRASPVVAFGALSPGALLAAVVEQSTPMPDLSDWGQVRAQFPLDWSYSHFASFFLVSHPKPVSDALDAYRRALDHNPYLSLERAMFSGPEDNLLLAVATEVADYTGGTVDEVCLTGSTTESLALVYQGLTLEPGDEVLTTTHDHYSHHESIRLAAEKSGASMRKISLFEDSSRPDTADMIRRLQAAITPSTRVVGLTWVHSSSGIRLPIQEISAALKSRPNAPLLVVDGVHGLGSAEPKVAELGADFFCAGTHKWMFAPRGTGIIWAREESWARLRPTVPSFTDEEAYVAWMQDAAPATPTNARRMMPGGFEAFEHRWATAAAFAMHRKIGRERVAARIAELNGQIKDGLAEIPRVRVHTPRSPEFSAGVVTFEVEGVPTREVISQLLERRIVASGSPYANSQPRLAASLVNTPEEVEAAVGAVREIAGSA